MRFCCYFYGHIFDKMQQSLNIKLLLISLVVCTVSWSQPYHWYGQPKPYKWMFGLGWNFVEDDGREMCQPFDVAQSWNGLSYPTRLTVDRYLKYGLSVEFAGAYTNYTSGKLINDSTGYSGMFLSFDLNCKYSFYNLIPPRWLDPYASLGVGMTQRSAFENPYAATGNIALGVNLFVWKGLGINLQTSGKVALTGEFFGSGNYLQHSIGLVYKINPEGRNNSFNKRQYKWINKKEKYKSGRKGGG